MSDVSKTYRTECACGWAREYNGENSFSDPKRSAKTAMAAHLGNRGCTRQDIRVVEVRDGQ